MELSPLAKERLARIGALSPEEKESIKQSGELDSILSRYFRGELGSEDLWKELKSLKDRSSESMVREAQLKLVDTLRLRMKQEDFEQRRSAILAVDMMKEEGKYSSLELALNAIEALRQKYTQAKEQAYEQLKASIEPQLQQMTQRAIKQGLKIDIESSLDANIKNSPQWKEFISEHERACVVMFDGYIGKLRELI